MTASEVRAERMAQRRQQILDAAREAAEADGWAAVTSRRLADAIGYTQPVLYGHFPGGKTEIMSTVALAGFTELTAAVRAAAERETPGPRAIEAIATAYLDFAAAHPALYEAMFQLPIDAHFASDESEAELRAGFDAIATVLGDDDGTATEVFWSALHGMTLLERAGRMRPEHRPLRVTELAARFGQYGSTQLQ